MVYGGLGYNIFNPAMVGRAFVMFSFAAELGASAYVSDLARLPPALDSDVEIVSQATPLTIAKQVAANLASGKPIAADLQERLDQATGLWRLFIGWVNGSLGETSALAVVLGGLYLCIRRVASWEIPVGVLLAATCCAAAAHWAGLSALTASHQLLSGALLFGAFFIATDPVTSPLTRLGKFIFGLGVGTLILLVRVFSGYPEGLMFAILVMNAAVPLINRWTIPRPVGGPVPNTT
jgi:electron transport complex protein RnfD